MKKILVIEDAHDILEEIVDTLKIENFDATGALDGFTGVQLARDILPDLIICDIMMPGMTGYEVLQELRQDSSTTTIPFIFLTALSAREDMRKGMELGADDYIFKPFTARELLNAIWTRLEKQNILEKQHLHRQARQLVESQETERRRIAHELQDEIGQLLTGLKFVLNMSKRLPPEQLKPKLAEAQAIVNELVHRVSELSTELRPTMLDDLGLLPTLLHHFKRYTEETGIQINFEHKNIDVRFMPEVETAAYRIIQEALTNVARHTSVTETIVQVWQDSGILNIQLEDAGEGFELNQVLTSGTAGGLAGMRDRVISLNGKLTVVSTPARGTQINAQIPVHPVIDAIDNHHHVPFQFPLNETLHENHRRTADGISIVLVERNEFLREGLKSILRDVSCITVKGETSLADDTLALIRQYAPQVLILDRGIGLDIIRAVKEISPGTHILILSRHADEAYVLDALQRGAEGYILKEAGGDELVEAIRTVALGKRYLSKALSERVMDFYVNIQRAENAALNTYQTLTEREREIFKLVAEGYKNTEIADMLTISPRTVETHRANLMRKLQLHNQADLIRYALEQGLIPSRR